MASLLEDLDSRQREAVFLDAGHILVAAPPGSGKTRVLAARFVRLLGEGIAPGAMAALTFTGKAAMEMAGRVAAFTGADISAAHIGTFHALCLGILKKHRPKLQVYGRAEQIEALQALGVKSPQKAADRISFVKNSGAGAALLDDGLRAIYEKYEAYLKKQGALDLDDLITEAALLLEGGGGEEVFGGGLLHIMVDEYQDINPPQARLLKALAKAGGHVFAIGDPDQAIYSFRGASLGFFMRFKDEWPDAVVMNLATNYRSASAIVSASQSLVRHNKERFDLTPAAIRDGGSVRFVACADEAALSRYIIKEIESRMGGFTSLASGQGGDVGSTSFSDFAVLFRSRRSARGLIEAFGAGNLPYHLAGPASGQGLVEFLHHLKGIRPGEGVRLIDLVKKESLAMGLEAGPSELLLWLASRYGEEEAGTCLEGFIGEAGAFGSSGVPEVEADKVNLMTLHAAKGLEFKTVFIAGVEDGLIPLRRKDASLEEERRLFYVGLTRAAEEVVLLSVERRRLYGAVEDREPSPFIAELGDCLKKISLPAPKKYRRRAVQKGLFE